jgi:hypothetical protein
MDKLDHVPDRKSMRVQDAFGAAIIAGREQFKRTDAVGLDVTTAVGGRIVSSLLGSYRFKPPSGHSVSTHGTNSPLAIRLNNRVGASCTIATACWPRRVSRRGHFSLEVG